MYRSIQPTVTIASARSIALASEWRGFLFIVLFLALAYLMVAPAARAVSPAPDGGYPGNNTAEGEDALKSNVGGTDNTALGFNALFANTEGDDNTATGSLALKDNTTGSFNTANGYAALLNNTTGTRNTGIGEDALRNNTTGNNNTGIGEDALRNTINGSDNTATGVNSLISNTTGSRNTATGMETLRSNETASFGTANGFEALKNNTTGSFNTGIGMRALLNNTTGAFVSAFGAQALVSNTTGGAHTATGVNALFHNTTGNSNTATGFQALFNNTTGGNNIALGRNAGSSLTTGSNNISVGNAAVAAEANTIRVGIQGLQTRTFVAGIRGRTTGNANAIPVLIDSVGQLGTASSSRRFKHDVKPMDQTSEAILDLKPVTFHYNEDNSETAQFGLIAEEVEKVNPDLVVHDEDGKIYTVRYEAVNAMLLNEFLKEHRKVEELETTVAQQRKEMESVLARLQEQESKIDKVALEVKKNQPAARLVSAK